MIVTTEKQDVALNSNNSSRFSIQASPKAFEILSSNIYSNKIRAVIREISTNALDAHIYANQDRPFQVHLPTNFEPFFYVRDYGTGLSQEEMLKTYTTYFFSTKTSSNDYVGALGLGSKSPYALVDSFLVTSFYQGVAYHYTCYKSEDGEPSISLLSSGPTDEPSGLKVYVDVADFQCSSFYREATYVYKFFSKIPDINIPSIKNEIEAYQNSMIINTPKIRSSLRRGTAVAVMGGVAYDISNMYFSYGVETEFHFDIGELSFDPGREKLSMDKKTIQAVQNAVSKFANEINTFIESAVEKEPSKFFKLKKAHEFSMMYSGHREISNFVKTLMAKYDIECDTYISYSRDRRGKVIESNPKGLIPLNSTFFLYKKGFSARIKEFARKQDNSVAVFTQEQIDAMGLESFLIRDPAELPKIERQKVKVKRGEIFLYKDGHISEFSGELPDEEKIYVTMYRGEGEEISIKHLKQAIQALKYFNLYDDSPIYFVARSFQQKKIFSKTKWVLFNTFIKRFEGQITDKIILSGGTMRVHAKLIRTGEWLDLYNLYQNLTSGHNSHLEVLSKFIKIDTDNSLIKLESELESKYPMISCVRLNEWDSEANKALRSKFIDYINLVDSKG